MAKEKVQTSKVHDTITVASDAAYEAEIRVKMIVRSAHRLWVDLARELYFIYRGQAWLSLDYETFEEWLAQPEVGVERRVAYDLIKMYREWVHKLGISEDALADLDYTKLLKVLPSVKAGQVEINQALNDAETLSLRDIIDRYSLGGAGRVETSNGTAPDVGTGYDAEREPAMVSCPTCGSRVRSTDVVLDA